MSLQTHDGVATYAVMTETLEQQRVLQHLAQGDTTAFWTLWERYRTERFDRYSLLWMQGNRADAEDALSGSSVKACQYLSNAPQNIVCMKSWLTRLLHNHCMDTWKARQTQAQCMGDAHRLLDVKPAASWSAQAHISAEDALLQQELGRHIRRAFDALPPRLREPSLLRFVHQMPYADIAEQLRLRPDNIRKRIQQARLLLQQQLRAYWADELNPADTLADLASSLTVCQDADTDAVLTPEMPPEIPTGRAMATHTFRITLPNGAEKQIYLPLDHTPVRQQQKVNALRKYVQQHPEGWRKHRSLGHLLYAMGQWREALTAYRQVLRKQPDRVEVWLRLGDMLHMWQREEDAVDAYSQASLRARQDVTHYHIAGLIAACRGQHAHAVQALQAAAALEPDNPVHQRTLGLAYEYATRPVEALNAFDTVLQHDPDDLLALTRSYEALRMTGRYTEAERRTARAVELDPNHVLALTRLAHHLSASSRGIGPAASRSRQLIRHAFKLAPEAPEVHAARAHYHMVRGEWAQGQTVLQHFTATHPKCPEGWRYSAQWHARSGDLETAASAIQHAYALAPHDAKTVWAGGAIWLDAGHLSALRPLIDKMRQDFAEDWRLQTMAGYALRQTDGDAERACAISARGPQLQPRLSHAWFRHGQTLALCGRRQEAIDAFQEGWRWLPPQDGETLSAPAALWLGESYEALGDAASARLWWEEAQRLASRLITHRSALGHYWQGKAWSALAHPDRARQALQTALRQHLFYPARQDAMSLLAASSPLRLAACSTSIRRTVKKATSP